MSIEYVTYVISHIFKVDIFYYYKFFSLCTKCCMFFFLFTFLKGMYWYCELRGVKGRNSTHLATLTTLLSVHSKVRLSFQKFSSHNSIIVWANSLSPSQVHPRPILVQS